MALHPYAELSLDVEQFQLLERFTVILYDKTSYLEHVDEARQELFCQKGKAMEALPPTQDALLQHSKRVAYQPGIWYTSEQIQNAPPQKIGDGLCGPPYLLPPKHVVNW